MITSALRNPDLTEDITRRRIRGSINADGELVLGTPADTPIRAAVEPLGEDRQPLAEGLRLESRWRVFTVSELQAVTSDNAGDLLFIRGRWHRVTRVEKYTGPLTGSDQAIYEAETVHSS